MVERTDILLDDDNDLLIEGGDLAFGDSNYQHIKHIMQAAPGHYKQFPTLGAKAQNFINGSSPELLREVKIQLLADGYSVSKLAIVDGQISIEA